MTDEPIRFTILVVAGHELVGSALALALRSRGFAADRVAVEDLAERLTAPALPGGLVLLDLGAGDGLDSARLVPACRRAGWRVLLLADPEGDARQETGVAAAVTAGAVGWVAKDAAFDVLVYRAVRAVQGRPLLADEDRRRLRHLAGELRRETEAIERRWERLTPREREILQCLQSGMRPSAIATQSCVSIATVRTQIRSILAKLEVGSQLEAAALARRR